MSANARGARLVALGVVLGVVLGGCRTVVTVDIVGGESGAGTVTVTAVLDAEAAKALGGKSGLVTDDLVKAGWRVEGPVADDDGSLRIVGSRAYSGEAQLKAVLAEVGGTDAVFSDVRWTATDGFGRTAYELGTTVSVSGDPAQFSDETLTTLLGGLPLGRTPEELATLGANKPGAGQLVVRVQAPDAPRESEAFDLTSAKPASARVESRSTQYRPMVFLVTGAGALLVLIGAVLVVRALTGSRRSRALTGSRRSGATN